MHCNPPSLFCCTSRPGVPTFSGLSIIHSHNAQCIHLELPSLEGGLWIPHRRTCQCHFRHVQRGLLPPRPPIAQMYKSNPSHSSPVTYRTSRGARPAWTSQQKLHIVARPPPLWYTSVGTLRIPCGRSSATLTWSQTWSPSRPTPLLIEALDLVRELLPFGGVCSFGDAEGLPELVEVDLAVVASPHEHVLQPLVFRPERGDAALEMRNLVAHLLGGLLQCLLALLLLYPEAGAGSRVGDSACPPQRPCGRLPRSSWAGWGWQPQPRPHQASACHQLLVAAA